MLVSNAIAKSPTCLRVNFIINKVECHHTCRFIFEHYYNCLVVLCYGVP